MKRLLFILMTFGVMTMPVSAQTISRDNAEVSSVVNSFATLADQGAFEYLGRLFTPAVMLDYTSLFAGEDTGKPRGLDDAVGRFLAWVRYHLSSTGGYDGQTG